MSAVHPEKEQLISFGQGKLAADESSSVEQHLEVCRECCETLLDLKDDTFVGLVRIARPDDLVAESSSVRTEHGTDEGCVGHDSPHSDTLMVQSGDTVRVNELPCELKNHPRYRIVELIGRGGMGNVYRAEHRLMNRPVAIKLINSQLIRQPEAVERFRREVQAAAKLTHPNIVTAYDAEQAGDVHFLVMEFVDGTDLSSVVKHRGPMSVAEACDCIRQAAEGLQHAHEKGMVHRDIKPHNLMLSAEGEVRILDFGLAGFVTEATADSISRNALASGSETENAETDKPDASAFRRISAAHLTAVGSVMGTPDYIAPEQVQDAHSADIRADIYSLGCTLHFLLTAKPPFEVDNVLAKLKAHAERAPESLAKLRSDVPQELSSVVSRMMAKNPAERFQTPAAVAEALAPFAKTTASPPKRRVRTRVAALWLCVAALLAGVIFVQTDNGRVEIRSEVNDVKVSIKQDGQEVQEIKVTDAQTGSQVKWLSSGEYEVELKDDRNDVEIINGGFKLTRWGKEVVTLKRKPDASGPSAKVDSIGASQDTPPTAQGNSPIANFKDAAAVLMYLNNPRNNSGGSVPVALLGREGRVAFRFGNWLVVFEGIACDPKAEILGFSNFNIPLRGSSGEGTIDFGAGDKLPGVLIKFKFYDEQNEISINNHRFKLRGKATRLEFDDKAYDATNSLQTILVRRDGSTRHVAPDTPNTIVEVGRFTGHEGSASHAIVSPGGRYGISCGADKTIRVWDIATQEEKRVLKGHEGSVFGLAISTDGKLLASGDNAKSIRLWNLESGEQVGELTGHTDAVTDLAFMPDRTHLLSAGFDDTLRLWHVADRKLVRTIDIGTRVEKLIPLLDGRRVMLSGAHTRGWGPTTYDLEKGEKIAEIPSAYSCMAVSADGRLSLVGSITGVLVVTDTVNENVIVQMTDPRANVARDRVARDAAITPDGRFAITTTRENRMYLWDLHGGKLLSTAEADTIGTITLSPDARFALTIGREGGVGIWRLPESVLEPIATTGPSDEVRLQGK